MEHNNIQNRTRLITQYGILIALAMILSYVESLVPAFFFVPGMKLGLTNVVVLIALYQMDSKAAMGINFIRIVLVSFLFGNMVSLIYSLAGGVLSTLVMIGLKSLRRFGTVAVSVSGGIAHNVGQIAAAVILMSTVQVWWYLVVLWFSGIVTGALIGILGSLIMKHLPRNVWDAK